MNVARPKARPAAVIVDQGRGAARAHPYLAATAVTIGALAISALVNRHLAQKAVRDNPPLGQFLEINGVRLHYIERGAGEPLVLLHGNGSMIQDFASRACPRSGSGLGILLSNSTGRRSGTISASCAFSRRRDQPYPFADCEPRNVAALDGQNLRSSVGAEKV